MYKSKKWMAATLAAAMVMGSSITVFATGTTPTTSGSTSGTGTSEGHVDKEVVNMVLPTIPSGSTPFAYTMDPERLIQETGGAKYEDFTFPAADSDTGVYFRTGEKAYANTSNTLQAINKSSCDVTLTVKVKATASAGGKDITLATSATPSTTGTELYLGLKVGETNTVVSTTEATVTKTVAGTAGNFETVYDATDGYKYQEKASATTWKAINLSMTGAVSNKAIAADTTAPTVDVTWSYAKAADNATVDTADQVDYTAAPPAPTVLEIKSGATAVTAGSADATAGITHTASLVKDTDTEIVIALPTGYTLSKVYVAGSQTGLSSNTENTSRAAISGNKVVLKGDADWASAAGTKYAKIVVTPSTGDAVTYIIKINITVD